MRRRETKKDKGREKISQQFSGESTFKDNSLLAGEASPTTSRYEPIEPSAPGSFCILGETNARGPQPRWLSIRIRDC